ncbi:hypothetical protein A2155_01395 [candidate division WWE3 bacterium RBG_16_52_45]|nr:MAG: hypothetical protein A2155_01395 [candidate division WWE3 bacterium RBG_16_52_45]
MGKFWGRIVKKIRPLGNLSHFPKTLPGFPQFFHKRKLQNIWKKLDFSTGKLPPILILLFSFIIFLFPNNLAKHLILPQSYVLGVLVDYLSPALYLTEILIALLLVLSLGQLLKRKLNRPQKMLLLFSGFFLATLLPSVWRGSFDLIGIWRWIEIALWLGFGFWVSVFVSDKWKRLLFLLLAAAVFWVSFLALGQFLTQHSLFGYWFLGEPELNPSLGGVTLGSWGGKEVLRAYGTFPHPNVLGGVLSIVLVWLWLKRYWVSFGVGLGALITSLSKTAWASFLGGTLGSFLVRSGLNPFFILWSDFSVSRRLELLGSAGKMLVSSPLAGVGLGQFTRSLPNFGLPSGLSLFVQPVHNIFALIAAESGILALLAFLALLFFALRQTIRDRRWWLTVSLTQLIFLGLFDHYLYTLPQGLFLFSLIIGLSFSYSDN